MWWGPLAPSSGAPPAPGTGASQAAASGGVPKAPFETLNDEEDSSLLGSSPGMESLPKLSPSNSPIVVVHRSNDNEEMEAQAVCRKRSLTLSPPHVSSRPPSNEKNEKKNSGADACPLPKRPNSSERFHRLKDKTINLSGKISLLREPNQKSNKTTDRNTKSK